MTSQPRPIETNGASDLLLDLRAALSAIPLDADEAFDNTNEGRRETHKEDCGQVGIRSLAGLSCIRKLSELLRARHCALLLVSGVLYDVARASALFLATYSLNQETHSARLVQDLGSASTVLLVLGPCFGAVSDRIDRKLACFGTAAVSGLGTVVVGVLLRYGRMSWPVMFAYAMVLSGSFTLDRTSRPPLVNRVLTQAGLEELVGIAMAFRTMGFMLGQSLGSLSAGALVDVVGLDWSFVVVAAVFSFAAVLILCIDTQTEAQVCSSTAFRENGIIEQLRIGAKIAVMDPGFRSMLGVTVIANFNYWSHTPLVQILATRLHATPTRTGLLGSAVGYGGLLAAMLTVAINPRRQGIFYCVGCILADVFLLGAAVSSFPVAFGSLLLSGLCVGFFSSVQTAMVMSMVPDRVRGQALGILSVAVGAMTLGMAALGELADWLGPPRALRALAWAGVIAQGLWLSAFPHALQIQRRASHLST